MKNKAYISLGSNIGDRAKYLKESIQKLQSYKGIFIANYSSIYETDPVDYENQSCFLNMVLELHTDFTAVQLLSTCLLIEKELGRERMIRFGPRTIDLDILLFNQENIKTEQLIIPHPRMSERMFVLIPLSEIKRDIIITGSYKKVEEIITELPSEGVRLWKQKNGGGVFELFES
ncbi:2-amino-4-hydroxy-6-hydroxymethyldihydropteridine diphosphokinase [Bacillus kwashiorkori]|uniref:2-amino-4-hydroxy-6- hydroxymethyldihydropteridine diphosphokinase n=1 Tax=Bacillus kwashiorkori TaxID=1522318 RepID=UPI000781A4F6|nr:2-amino-4-hydroxy-6-hydroxymethyldihydropteridine diphosphokinase [Bacillus kwashiorkori]